MRKREQKQTMVNDYQAPSVELLEVAVETGFAGSIDFVMPEDETGISDMGWG